MKGIIGRRVAQSLGPLSLLSFAGRKRGGAGFRASLLALALVVGCALLLLHDQSSGVEAQELPEIVAMSNGEFDDDIPFTEGDTAFFYLLHDYLDQPVHVSVTFTQSGNYLASGWAGRRTITLNTGRGWHQTSIRVPTVDDNLDEANGSITMTINPGSTYTVAPSYPDTTVRMLDNDEPTITISDPAISIRAGSAVREGGTARFTLTANPRPASPLPVNVKVTQHGDFAASSQIGSRTVTIGTNGRGTLSVATTDDGVDEDDGSITVTVVDGAGYSVGSSVPVSVVVTDGGTPTPRISISTGPNIDEGGTATFNLRANPAPASSLPVTVNVTQRGDFATGGQTGSRTVNIGTDGRGTLSVATTNDDRAEADGAITAALVRGAGYAFASPSSATVRVRDLGGIQVSIARKGRAVIEGETAIFELTASRKPASSISVNLRLSVSGDFVSGSQSWTTTTTVGSDGKATFNVVTSDDSVDERDGSVTATVTGGSDYIVGSPASATIQINDNDVVSLSRRTVSVGDAQVQENPRTGPWSLLFPISMSLPADEWVIVAYETRETPDADNPATPGDDYYHRHAGMVFFPGETEKNIPVLIFDDEEAEEIETLEIVLTNIIGPADIIDGVATGSILPDPHDADRGITEITLSVQPAVVEGQPFSFTLTAMPPPKDRLPIQITVTDGYEHETTYTGDFIAAGNEGDQTVTYPGDVSLIWTLPEGQNYTRKTFTIPTVNDRIDEADGPVFVEVLAPDDGSYVAQAPYRGAVIVYDNDGGAPQMPVVSVSDGNDGETTTEAAGVVWFNVELDRPVHPDGMVTVYYSLQSGTARPREDFVVKSGEVVFYGGDDFKSIAIQIVDDDVTEGAETFKLKLSFPEGATIGDDIGIATIEASD